MVVLNYFKTLRQIYRLYYGCFIFIPIISYNALFWEIPDFGNYIPYSKLP